jgi:dihydrodipicolinate synthase/N-acetylneuraminate lyase
MGRSKRRYDELLLFFQAVADRSPLPIVLAYGPTRPPLTDILSAIVTHPNIVGYLYCTTNQTEVRWQLSRNGLEPYPPGTGRQLPLHRIGLTRLVEQTAAIKRQVTVTHTFAAVTSRMKSAAGSDVPDLISARSLAGSGPSIAEVATKREVRTRTKSVGFQIITSNTLQMLEALNTGATGIAPAFAACAPQACYEVFAAWKDQDQPLASEKQQRIVEAARLVESLGPSALKFAADLNGYFGGPPRLPYLPLTRE